MDDEHRTPVRSVDAAGRGESNWWAGLSVGRLRGVALRISPLWAGVLIVVTVLYPGIAERLVPGVGRVGGYLVSFVLAVLLLVSVLAHEVGHLMGCWAAGVPVRSVLLSVPGDSVRHDEPGAPRQAAIVAAGGPVASLVLTGLCAALAQLGSADDALTSILGATVVGNLAVTGFTLLPGLPMDGGELVRAAVWAMSGSAAVGERVAGRAGRVLAVVVALGALLFVRTDNPFGSMVVLLAGGLVAVFLWRGAGRTRQGQRPASAHRTTGWATARAWLPVGLVSVAAMLLVRAFVLQSLVVVSDSMDDTLHTGDRIVSDKLSIRVFGIQRGDVVVLRQPAGVDVPAGELVKRVIGLPGDRLSNDAGVVVRNGVPLVEPYLRPGCADDAAGLGSLVVPAGKVYLLGDNRCHSVDSRSFGAVDEDLVQGRVVGCLWPVDRLGIITDH